MNVLLRSLTLSIVAVLPRPRRATTASFGVLAGKTPGNDIGNRTGFGAGAAAPLIVDDRPLPPTTAPEPAARARRGPLPDRACGGGVRSTRIDPHQWGRAHPAS